MLLTTTVSIYAYGTMLRDRLREKDVSNLEICLEAGSSPCLFLLDPVSSIAFLEIISTLGPRPHFVSSLASRTNVLAEKLRPTIRRVSEYRR